ALTEVPRGLHPLSARWPVLQRDRRPDRDFHQHGEKIPGARPATLSRAPGGIALKVAMGITRRTRRQIAGEAVDWFLQFQEGAVADSERQSFSEWLLRSPAHVEEYLRVSCSWSLANADSEGDLAADALIAAAKAHHEIDNVVALP